MPKAIQLLPVSAFDGGLNLRADAFQLRGTESPDLLNVDLDPRGGFRMRDVITPLNTTAFASVARNIWAYSTSAGVRQVLVQQGDDFAYSTGGSFTAVNPDALTMTAGNPMRAATFNDLNYIQRYAEQPAIKWDGSTATVLTDPAVTPSYNDTIGTTVGSRMPKARCISSFAGRVVVANLKENSTPKPNRIRWSHPNAPEEWRTNDYIDVDIGSEGDYITALAPWGDSLLIFKNKSTHILSGYDSDTFTIQTVSKTIGAVSQEAVAATEFGVYFFAWPGGVFLYTGSSSPKWCFERLSPTISGGNIPAAYQSQISLAWLNRRLWVSVPYGTTATTPSRVYVLDPTLGEKGMEGGWTVYDLTVGPMLEWATPANATLFLATHPTVKRVMKLHQQGDQDTIDGSAYTDISSYYTTRWFDLDEPSLFKKWKRPDFVFDRDFTALLRVDTWKDYDPSNVSRSYYLQVTPLGTVLVWDDGTHSANMKWDNNVWASDVAAGAQGIAKGSAMGRARSIRLRVTGPTPSKRWSVNAVGLKWVPRRVRG